MFKAFINLEYDIFGKFLLCKENKNNTILNSISLNKMREAKKYESYMVTFLTDLGANICLASCIYYGVFSIERICFVALMPLKFYNSFIFSVGLQSKKYRV